MTPDPEARAVRIRAALDAEEQQARAARWGFYAPGCLSPQHGAFIAAHSPDRALRDLAADRQTLDDCLTALREHSRTHTIDTGDGRPLSPPLCDRDGYPAPCPDARRALALLDRLDARYVKGDSA